MKKLLIYFIAIFFLSSPNLQYAIGQNKPATQQQIIQDLENYLQQKTYGKSKIEENIMVCRNSRFSDELCKKYILQQIPHRDFILDNCKKCQDSPSYNFESCLNDCLNNIKKTQVSTAPNANSTKEANIQSMKKLFSNRKFIDELVEGCAGIDARVSTAKTCFMRNLSDPDFRHFVLLNGAKCFSDSISLSEFGECMLQASNDLQQQLTPLHQAAKAGNLALIKKLVAELVTKRATIDTQTAEGNTPLHLATQNNHKDAVEALLDAGANMFIKNKAGQTPLDMANQEIAELLRIRAGSSF